MSTSSIDALKAQLASLSAEERAALLEPEPRKRTPLDVSEALKECFIADLVATARVRDPQYCGERGLWFIGDDNAKGPKGGVYLYGRVNVGSKENSRRGMLKIASSKFRAFKDGGTETEAWVRFDGETTDTLVGVLSNYRASVAPKGKTAAATAE